MYQMIPSTKSLPLYLRIKKLHKQEMIDELVQLDKFKIKQIAKSIVTTT